MSEFEINVKQTQSGSSIKDAGNDLRDLKTVTSDVKKAGVDTGESFEQTGRKISATTGVMSGAMRLLKGDMTGIVQIGQSIRGLFAGIGPLIAVVGSALAGWKVGTIVREWIDLKTTTFDTAEGVVKTKEEFEKVNKVKLDALAKEIKGIQDRLKETLADLSRIYAMRKQEADAIIDRELAKTRTEKESPARDRKIADLEKQKAQSNLSLDIEQNVMNLQELEPARKKIKDKIDSLQAEVDGLEAKRKAAIERIQGATPGDKGPMAKQVRAELSATETANKEALKEAQKELKEIDQQIAQERSNRRVQSAQKDTIVYERKAKETPILKKEREEATRDAAADKVMEFGDAVDSQVDAQTDYQKAQARLKNFRSEKAGHLMSSKDKAELKNLEAAVETSGASLKEIAAIVLKLADQLKDLRDQVKNAARN
jgi:DNA repair exonuclease SbcCD ATPase subunit